MRIQYTVPQFRLHSSAEAFRPAALLVVAIATVIPPPRALPAGRLGTLDA
jgi:hypothetical protein